MKVLGGHFNGIYLGSRYIFKVNGWKEKFIGTAMAYRSDSNCIAMTLDPNVWNKGIFPNKEWTSDTVLNTYEGQNTYWVSVNDLKPAKWYHEILGKIGKNWGSAA